MNGDELTKLRVMKDGEWRGYLTEKVESTARENRIGLKRLEVAITAHAVRVGEVVTAMNDMKVQLAKIPEHCVQVDNIRKLNERVDDLEDDRVGRRAVSKALWGVGSVLGVVVTGLTILRLTGVI